MNNNIKDIIESSSYQDISKNKTFYSLKEFVKENNICSFNLAINAAQQVKQDLNLISYPSGLTIQYVKDTQNGIKEIFLNADGLMLVMAKLSKSNDVKNKDLCYDIAKYLRNEKKSYYPDTRALCRLEYTDVTKELRSKIKKYLESYNKYELSEQIALIYHTILKNYYFLTGSNVKDDLNKLKTDSYNKSYLDYITARELKDLTEIQKKAIYCLEHSDNDILTVVSHEAQKRRVNFLLNYAGKYPEQYQSHTNKPAKMLSDFTKLLKDYDLDLTSLNDYENNK